MAGLDADRQIVIPEPAIQLADEVVLWRAVLGTEWMDERFDGRSDDNSEFTVHGFIGDRLPRVTRWLRLSRGEQIDTGVGAQLLTVEEGTGVVASSGARAEAQYALAVWAILEPPKEWKLLPDLGIWVQQPSIQVGQRFKPREHEQWIAQEQVKGNSIRFWGEYEAPQADVLRIPFQAVDNLECRSTQALLSAALAHRKPAAPAVSSSASALAASTSPSSLCVSASRAPAAPTTDGRSSPTVSGPGKS